MKRIFGFVAGLSLVTGLAYGLRRLLTSDAAPPSEPVQLADTPPSVRSSTPASSASDADSDTPTRTVTRYTVRRTGPRPQAPGSPETPDEVAVSSNGQPPPAVESTEAVKGFSKNGAPAEPLSVTNSDQAAVSSRSEMTEPTILNDVPVKTPKSRSATRKTPVETADFTRIHDLGPVFNTKLHEAGIKTFAALAALTPEQIEEKTAIPAARVVRSDWLKQAAQLAEGLEPEN